MSYHLIKIFGLQRSGNHAVINWLLGLNAERMLFFNMLRPGAALREKPSAISLPDGVQAYARRVNGKRELHPELIEAFRAEGGELVCSFENVNLNAFDQALIDTPIRAEFGDPVSRCNIVVLRNPFNMLPSAYRMLEKNDLPQDQIRTTLERRLRLWQSYAMLATRRNSPSRGPFVPIVFDHWVHDRAYRDAVARELGYENRDRFRDFVSDAGGGSSFAGTSLDPADKSVTARWQMDDRADMFLKMVVRQQDLVDQIVDIFGADALPEGVKLA